MIDDDKIRKSGRYVALAGIVAGWVFVVWGIVQAIYLESITHAPASRWLSPALGLLVLGCVIHALLVAAWTIIGKQRDEKIAEPKDENG
jgi:hypothetical protein